MQLMAPDRYQRSGPSSEVALARLTQMRASMGITRVGDLTGLDIVGIPVMQAVRPLSCSNAVSQGKGVNATMAAISAMLECAETRFAERIDRYDVVVATANELNIPDGWFDEYLQTATDFDWRNRVTSWVECQDVLSGKREMLPFELVHTNYLLPQNQLEGIFISSTTGLAAAFAPDDAISHAILECIERDAISRAMSTRDYFQRYRIDPSTITDPAVQQLLELLRSKGFLVGLWQAESAAKLPVVWCHLMERDPVGSLLPFHADGSAASLDPGAAIIHAIYEAAQTRLAAISGAREDITRLSYPKYPDLQMLTAHRKLLSEGPFRKCFADLGEQYDELLEKDLLSILLREQISSLLIVRIETEPFSDLSVVRVLIPHLRPLCAH